MVMVPLFFSFVENYCWAEGTYAVDPSEFMADKPEKYADKKITYYQWVPFMLGLQAILFYIPRIVWSVFSYNRTGKMFKACFVHYKLFIGLFLI